MLNARPLHTLALSASLALTAGGCGAKAQSGIPVEAQRVATGKGGQIVHKLRAGGEVFVLDATTNKVVWNDFLRKDDTLTVAPGEDFIAVGLQTVDEPDLDRNHKYSVYLRRD